MQSVKDSDVIYRDAVTGEEHQLHADAILLATGRRPNTAGLNLAAAGVEVNERGAIVVDDYLQTTNPKIHAIGDVKGGLLVYLTFLWMITAFCAKTFSGRENARCPTVTR